MDFRYFFTALVLSLSLNLAKATITVGPWVSIFQGIEFATGETDTNEVRLHKVRAIRVDMSNPAVAFFSTPAGGPMETIGQTTTTFVNTYGCSVGLNANFFSPVSTIPNDPRELIGLAICSNAIVSSFEAGRPSVLITRSNQVSFITSALANYNNVWTAVSGSDRVLINGVAQLAGCTTSFCNENPRSAVGLSSNGRYFIMMVVDGRQAGWSDGATLFETGQWLARFGAHNGLNLDGGGSTAMAKLESGAAVLLNRPSGGVQRVNGNHLGVFAPPVAPVIMVQPQNQTVPVDATATFTVFAGGTTPLRYQWRFNGTNIAGATSTNLTVTSVQLTNAGLYTVEVSNLVGITLSSNASLAVTYPFELTNLVVQARPSSAVILWETMPAATSQIEYGIAPGFGKDSELEASARTNHAMLLTGLVPYTNYNFRIRSFSGPNEVVSGPFFFSTDISIVVDNPQASYSGNWTLGTSSVDKFGSYYQYTATTSDVVPSAMANYAPAITTAGKYDVAIWYPEGSNRSSDVPVTIFHDGGAMLVRVNQTTGGGAWRVLATGLNCSPGALAFIGNNTSDPGTVVMADAMRWSYAVGQENGADGTVPGWWSGYYFGGNINASLDPDGDGQSTHDEYILGTNPTNAASRFVTSWNRMEKDLVFTLTPWQGGRIYELQAKANLSSNWQSTGIAASETNGQGTLKVETQTDAGPRFFRIAVRLFP
jgi:hypothetical protein